MRSEKKRNIRHRWLKAAFCAAFICAGLAFASVSVLRSKGLMFDSAPHISEYPCRGALLSENSGRINWDRFNESYISFVYIRASKGISFKDRQFENNRKGVVRSGLPYGFIHDFDFTSDGGMQAEAFLELIGDLTGQLVPVIDLRKNLFERLFCSDSRAVSERLSELIEKLSQAAGGRVMLWVDRDAYDEYQSLAGNCLILAEDSDTDAFCPDWTLLAYSDNGSSAGLADKGKYYTELSAGNNVTKQELEEQLRIKNDNN